MLASASVAVALAASPGNALAQEWPKLKAGDGEVCATAMSIATESFKSGLRSLALLRAIGPEHGAKLVLNRKGNDISGGHALAFDPSVFEEIPDGPPDEFYGQRSVYWQRKAQDGLRFVAVEFAHSWRGDNYVTFVLPAAISKEAFLSASHRNDRAENLIHPPIETNTEWQPPLFFVETRTSKVWSIGVGAPYVFLEDWKVYGTGPDGAKLRCVIAFRPDVESADQLMPSEVRDLMLLLDGIVGDGHNDGTSARTSVLRSFAASVWANAALRPWAVGEGKRSSRAYVDKRLKDWSLQAKSFRTVYDKILLAYPEAERALTNHYVSHFGMSQDEANVEAARVLDIAFRSNFEF